MAEAGGAENPSGVTRLTDPLPGASAIMSNDWPTPLGRTVNESGTFNAVGFVQVKPIVTDRPPRRVTELPRVPFKSISRSATPVDRDWCTDSPIVSDWVASYNTNAVGAKRNVFVSGE